MLEPTTPEELRRCISDHGKVAIQGGCTKRRLVGEVDGRQLISTRRLAGVAEYKPDEYVFTALAGTRLSEIVPMLAEHGQYLPFDPPLVGEGATLGGSVAAGLNGPGSYRFGGLRDFVLAVRFVDGRGRLITGGGKVVKNAAGFDFPKLMVGSLGRIGAIAELTLKVFPQPDGLSYLRMRCSNLSAAVSELNDLANRPWDLDALDLLPSTSELKIRLRGDAAALEARRERIGADIDPGGPLYWNERDSLAQGRADDYLAKVPITPRRIGEIARRFRESVISVGGNVAWVSSPSLSELEDLGTPALIVRGRSGATVTGPRRQAVLHAALKRAFDPDGRFAEATMN